ncbi:MAG: plasmid stabilization protein [Betaproteobacteria bacterium]|nr:plasmid stabilization protein [Betaproteobacteria bacterium]
MPSVTVRNLPEEVHRAIRVRAARNGCSLEAEMRNILASAVMPKQRVKLGSRLAEVGRKIRLTDEELAVLESARDRSAARLASFE